MALVKGLVAPRFSPDDLAQTATIYDVSSAEHRVPIVELWVVEHNRTCEVTIRCYDSRSVGWLQGFTADLPTATPSTQVISADAESKPIGRPAQLLPFLRQLIVSSTELKAEGSPDSRATENSAPTTAPPPTAAIEEEPGDPKTEVAGLADKPGDSLPDATDRSEKRRRGPKLAYPPDKIEAICIEWLEEAQYTTLMVNFCHRYSITDSQLSRWLHDREMRPKGSKSIGDEI